jgi:hypothetical protein
MRTGKLLDGLYLDAKDSLSDEMRTRKIVRLSKFYYLKGVTKSGLGCTQSAHESISSVNCENGDVRKWQMVDFVLSKT